MKIGIMMGFGPDVTKRIAEATSYGLYSCQLCSWDMAARTPELAKEVMDACETYGMSVSTFWVGWSGPAVWNFTEGPVTLGLLPPAYRNKRIKELVHGADYALTLGIKQVATHAGFIPENPHDPMYADMIDALRVVAEHLKRNGQFLLFETGQETPVALMRAFEDIGTGNCGVNLDTGNLILYGKANPVDALDMIGKYVMDLHVKDALYPVNGWSLGEEVPVGEGKADFPRIIAGLKKLGYDGALTIEREISGPKQIEDILRAKALLEKLI